VSVISVQQRPDPRDTSTKLPLSWSAHQEKVGKGLLHEMGPPGIELPPSAATTGPDRRVEGVGAEESHVLKAPIRIEMRAEVVPGLNAAKGSDWKMIGIMPTLTSASKGNPALGIIKIESHTVTNQKTVERTEIDKKQGRRRS
jgi:hypothetical protein